MKNKQTANLKKHPVTPTQDSGAPAALKAIESHELRCRNEKESAYLAWKEAQSKRVEGDDVSERAANRAHREYQEALELWDDSTKKLAVFDKGVVASRREGEKILVSEAQEMFSQLLLSIRQALESVILSDAYAASLGKTPTEFYESHAATYRAAMDGAIDAAKREGVLKDWITS